MSKGKVRRSRLDGEVTAPVVLSSDAANRYVALVDRADRVLAKLSETLDPAEQAEIQAELRDYEERIAAAKGRLYVAGSLDALRAQAEKDPDRGIEPLLEALAAAERYDEVVRVASAEIERLRPRGKVRSVKVRLRSLAEWHSDASEKAGAA